MLILSFKASSEKALNALKLCLCIEYAMCAHLVEGLCDVHLKRHTWWKSFVMYVLKGTLGGRAL